MAFGLTELLGALDRPGEDVDYFSVTLAYRF